MAPARIDGLLAERESRLRKDLQSDPNDAQGAANLGGLLIKKREFAEAAPWLKKSTHF